MGGTRAGAHVKRSARVALHTLCCWPQSGVIAKHGVRQGSRPPPGPAALRRGTRQAHRAPTHLAGRGSLRRRLGRWRPWRLPGGTGPPPGAPQTAASCQRRACGSGPARRTRAGPLRRVRGREGAEPGARGVVLRWPSGDDQHGPVQVARQCRFAQPRGRRPAHQAPARVYGASRLAPVGL